jgi:hypothetical protein
MDGWAQKFSSLVSKRVQTNDGSVVEVYAYPRGIAPMRRNNWTVFAPAIVVFGRALLLYLRHVAIYRCSWVVDIRDGDTLDLIVEAEVPNRAAALARFQGVLERVGALERSEVQQALENS